FCGEVHDITFSRYGGVTQVVHGALIGNHSPINYLRVDVHPGRLQLTSMQIDVQLGTGSLWQTGSNRPRSNFDIPAATRAQGYQPVGYAELTRLPGGGSWVTQATGTLAPYGTYVNGTGPTSDHLVDLDFDQLTGNTFVNAGSTGLVNNGTAAGNVTLTTGVVGQAVTLGGAAGDEVVAGPSPLAGAHERTVSVWARTSAASGIVTPLTLGTNGNGSKWDMDIDCANGGVFELGVGGGRTTGQGPALNDGQWHLLTTVLPTGANDLSQVRLFVDGNFVYTGSGSRAISTGGGDLVVGRSANAPATIQFFPGSVDDVVVWSEPFTDAQVRSLFDVATEPSLRYAADDFEQLLEVYRQSEPEVTIGGRVWRRATGLTGPAGLTVLGNGGYELLFDPATGAGVHVVWPAAAVTIGAGCPGTGNLTPAIAATGAPVTGTTFSVDLSDALANSVAAALFAFARNDQAIGNGCTSYPQLPGVTSLLLTSGVGAATAPVSIPANPSLIGLEIFAQWGVLDPAGAYGPNVAAFSGGLRATIGDV
ncbi:MAG: LamG domain-containing protein, partial [Planctomycetes bacterium]|nr:LamG domain-containing protein [Planctomycetota bacterium]